VCHPKIEAGKCYIIKPVYISVTSGPPDQNSKEYKNFPISFHTHHPYHNKEKSERSKKNNCIALWVLYNFVPGNT
jgi:hypothetical protein